VRKVGLACKSAVSAHAIEFTHPTGSDRMGSPGAATDPRGQPVGGIGEVAGPSPVARLRSLAARAAGVGVYSVGDQEREDCEQNAHRKTPARDYVGTAPAPPQPNFVASQIVHPCRSRCANEFRVARVCIARAQARVERSAPRECETAEHRQVGVKSDTLDATDAKERDAVGMLQAAELSLYGGAATVKAAPFGTARDAEIALTAWAHWRTA
jgi:hypothetical protein